MAVVHGLLVQDDTKWKERTIIEHLSSPFIHPYGFNQVPSLPTSLSPLLEPRKLRDHDDDLCSLRAFCCRDNLSQLNVIGMMIEQRTDPARAYLALRRN